MVSEKEREKGPGADDAVPVVRRFNRVVTERIGVLDERYLARDRPLGASRVLWEVGRGAVDVRDLRARLGLDSGYLSRLLRRLEAEGLIETAAAEDDARVRTVALSAAGTAEYNVLDSGADRLAASLLEPLTAGQRTALVTAMATVERLLTAGLVEIATAHPATTDVRHCFASYMAELDDRFDAGFDPSMSISADDDELVEPAGLVLVARIHDEPVGCVALKIHDDDSAEVKRMWVAKTARGLGLGRRLLAEVESAAIERGVVAARLETNRALIEAISLYRAAGYREVPAFNDEPFAHHWFEKKLS